VTGLHVRSCSLEGNSYDKRREGLAGYRRLLSPQPAALRMIPQWAPALGLAHVAEGRVQALACNATCVEDHAAGALLVREAVE
jgi:fructose-1,6-bisphosphatase/inositol monophosphatase family enzyme